MRYNGQHMKSALRIAVILDDVRSVHNVGSVFRTADAVGAEKIYACGITPGPLDRFKNVRKDFAKVALGAEKSVAWEAGGDIAEVIARLKKEGWLVYAIEQSSKSIPYYEVGHGIDPSDKKFCLIMGNEVDGVSSRALALADGILEIPMQGKKESLNVAVSFGIVAFDLLYGVVKSKKWLGEKK
jgi:tRNA G18 (ribose-2'-O)-methylase SpoU